MFGKPAKPEIVISKPDLESALNHLNNMPHTTTNDMPRNWGIQQVKEWMIEDLPKKVKIGDSFDFGTGLWGHIVPLGYEFSNYDNKEHKLQIIVSVRAAKTDLDSLETVNI